jgi:hypothetical protein
MLMQIPALTIRIFISFMAFKFALLKVKSIIIKMQQKIKKILVPGALLTAVPDG